MSSPDEFAQPATEPRVSTARRLSTNLASAWKGSPTIKLLILGVPVLAIIAGYSIFSTARHANSLPSAVRQVNPISSNPGVASTPQYENAVGDYDRQRAQEALPAGRSAALTPRLPSAETPAATTTPQDPLAAYRQAQEEQHVPTLPGPAHQNKLEGAMQKRVDELVAKWNPTGPLYVAAKVDPTAGHANAAPGATAGATSAKKGRVLESAGMVRYAETLTESNSDSPSPVLAELLAGPFKGGRVLGKFQVTNKVMTLTFTTLSYQQSTYEIDAIAVDPDTTSAALADDVDNHYFERLVLPAAAGFVQGLGTAASQPHNTISLGGNFIVSQNPGLNFTQQALAGASAAAQAAGQILNAEAAATKPTIIVNARRPIGILFLKPIRDTESTP